MKGDEKISDIMPKEFKEMSEVAVTKHLPDHLLSYVQPVSQNMHLFEMRFLDDVDAQEVAQRTERPTRPTRSPPGMDAASGHHSVSVHRAPPLGWFPRQHSIPLCG